MEDKQIEMQPDAQSRLAKLRAKHKSLRKKSIQKIEEAKHSLEYNSVSGDDQTINSLSSEGTGIFSATSFSGSPFGIKLPQHQEITLLEENRRLKEQLTAFSARQEVSRKQYQQQAETIRKLREDFQSLTNNEIERVKQKLQEIANDRDELERSVREDWQQRENEQRQELERLREQLSEVQNQLKIAKVKLKQQDYHDWLDEWSRTTGKEVQHISKLLGGLEIRDPDSQRRLQDLRKWLDRWTQIAQNVQDLKSQEQPREMEDSNDSSADLGTPNMLNAAEFDGLKAEMEQVIVKLQELREQLDSAENEENIHNLEHQIEDQLERWGDLERRMDEFTHTALLIGKEEEENEKEDAEEKAATIKMSLHEANLAKTNVLTKSVKKVQTLLEEIQLMVSSQHTQERQSLSSASVSSSASEASLTVSKDLVPGKDDWSGARLPPTSLLGKGEHPSLDESIEEISHKSSSSDEYYPPTGKQERLLTIFEFDRTDSSTASLNISKASLSVASTNSSVSVEPFRPAALLSIEDLLHRSWKAFQESISGDDDNVEEEEVVFTNQEEDDFEVASAEARMAEVIENDDTLPDTSVRSDVGTPRHANKSRKHATQGVPKVRIDSPQVMTGNEKKKSSVISASGNSGSETDDLDAAKVAEYEAYLMQMSTKNFYGDSSDDDTNLESRNSKDNSASVSSRSSPSSNSSSSSSRSHESNSKGEDLNTAKLAEYERFLMQMSAKNFYGDSSDDDMNLESKNSKDDESSVSSSRSSSSSSSSPSSRSTGSSKKSEEGPRGNPVSANADAVKVAQCEAYLMQMSTENFCSNENYDTTSQGDFKSGNNSQKQLVLPPTTNWAVSSSEDGDDSTVSNGGPASPTFLKKPFKPWFKEAGRADVASSRDDDSLDGDAHLNLPPSSDTENYDSQYEVASHSAGEANYEIASNNSDGDNDSSGEQASKSAALNVGKVVDYEAFLMRMSTKKFYGDSSDDDMDLQNVAGVKNKGTVVDTDIVNSVAAAEHEAYLMRMSIQDFSCFSNNGNADGDSTSSGDRIIPLSSNCSSNGNDSSTSESAAASDKDGKSTNLDHIKVAEFESYLMQMSTKNFYGDSSDDNMDLESRNSKKDATSVSSSSSSSNHGSSVCIESSDDNARDEEDTLNAAKVAENKIYLNQMSGRELYINQESDSFLELNDQHSTDAELSGPEIEIQMKAQKSLNAGQFMWLSTDDFQSSFGGVRLFGESTGNIIDSSSDSSDGYNAYRNEALEELERYAKTVSQDKATNGGRLLKIIDSGGSKLNELTDDVHEYGKVEQHIKNLGYSANNNSDSSSSSENSIASTHQSNDIENSTHFVDYVEALNDMHKRTDDSSDRNRSVYEEASDISDSEHEVASMSAHPEMSSSIHTCLSKDLAEAEEECKDQMHISISNHISGRSIDFDVLISSDLTIFDGIYNHEKVLLADIRKWKKHCAKQVKDGFLEVRCKVFDKNETRSFSVEEMKATSTQELANQLSNPLETITLVLQCDETKKYESKKPEDTLNKELQLIVTNELSGVYRELRVTTSNKLNMFEAVYQNDAVLSGKVRLWPPRIAKMVKGGTHEIQCLLENEDHDCSRIFTINELKTITTAGFAVLVVERDGPINLILRCREVEAEACKS